MSVKRISVLIEIAFWNVAILLLSKSSLFQGFVKGSYQLFESLRYALDPTKVAVWAISGWGLGFVVGFIGSFLLR